MDLFCEECKEKCTIIMEDDSFTHPFGREEIFNFLSDCCQASIINQFGNYVPDYKLKELYVEQND